MLLYKTEKRNFRVSIQPNYRKRPRYADVDTAESAFDPLKIKNLGGKHQNRQIEADT